MVDRLRQEWLAACLAYDEQRLSRRWRRRLRSTRLKRCASKWGSGLCRGGQSLAAGRGDCAAGAFRVGAGHPPDRALLLAVPPATRPGRSWLPARHKRHHVFGLLLLTFLLPPPWMEVGIPGGGRSGRATGGYCRLRSSRILVVLPRCACFAATLLEAARALQGRALIGYGEGCFNRCRRSEPGSPAISWREIAAAADAVDLLMSSPRPAGGGAVPAEARAALEHFRERRGSIEARDGPGRPRRWVCRCGTWPMPTRRFALHLEAALALGTRRLSTPISPAWSRGCAGGDVGRQPGALPGRLPAGCGGGAWTSGARRSWSGCEVVRAGSGEWESGGVGETAGVVAQGDHEMRIIITGGTGLIGRALSPSWPRTATRSLC